MSDVDSRSDPVLRRAITWLLVLTLLFIVYASLYPFEFDLERLRALGAQNGLTRLAWRNPTRTDLIANLLFYLPFGIWVAYLTPRRWSPLRRAAFAALAGAALSLPIELLQFTTRDRDPALADLALNSLSAGLGAALMSSARGLGVRPILPRFRAQRPDVVALLLVVLWLAFHAAPFMPTARSIWYVREPVAILDWHWSLAAIAGFFAGYVLLGAALRNLLQPASFWPVFAAVVTVSWLARIVVRSQQLELNECLGLALALPLIARTTQTSLQAALWVGPALIFFLLAPFEFSVSEPSLRWLADLPLVHRTRGGEPGLMELTFLYVGCLWLLCESGLNLRRVALMLFVVAVLIELVQAWQPGKSPHWAGPLAILAGASCFGFVSRTSKLSR